jgi:Fe-Mn family superoxide dismutase
MSILGNRVLRKEDPRFLRGEGSYVENLPLEDIVRSSEGKIFNNAAQVWNHTFYWNRLSPNAAGKPAGALLQRIEQQFGSFEQFQKQFTETAVGLFGA